MTTNTILTSLSMPKLISSVDPVTTNIQKIESEISQITAIEIQWLFTWELLAMGLRDR